MTIQEEESLTYVFSEETNFDHEHHALDTQEELFRDLAALQSTSALLRTVKWFGSAERR